MSRSLVWIGVGTDAEADRWRTLLGPEIDQRFGTVSDPGADLPCETAWRDAETGQVRADAVLDALIDRHEEGGAPEAGWLLGVTRLDLGAPGRPFVFGQATVGGCCALVSVARLDDGSQQCAERVLVTIMHELMHVAGLDHCENPGCVMWASSTVEDTDRKGSMPCADCAALLVRYHTSDSAAPIA